MASKNIIVAAREIIGGTKDSREVLETNSELTSAKQKALGLKKDDIDGLLASGALVEVSARVAEGDTPDDGVALAAEKKRADAAQAKVSELEKKVAELEKKVAPAS